MKSTMLHDFLLFVFLPAAWVRVRTRGTLNPGMVCTPASAAIFLDSILSPMLSIAPEGGPTKATPAFSHASAKEAFSLRKPYL